MDGSVSVEPAKHLLLPWIVSKETLGTGHASYWYSVSQDFAWFAPFRGKDRFDSPLAFRLWDFVVTAASTWENLNSRIFAVRVEPWPS
jgi:hypothetical protein